MGMWRWENASQNKFSNWPQDNASGYVLLSNIYAAAGNWDLSVSVQRQRMERGVKKQPGCTWIEVNDEVHTFLVND
jgi:hypothetical protein